MNIANLEQAIVADDIERIVVGALIKQEGRYLILRRSDTESFLPGFDEIPSGHVEPNESIIDGLHREVYEETGLRVFNILSFCNSFDYRSSSGKKTRQLNFLVQCHKDTIKLNPQEHQAFFWLSPQSSEFAQLKLSPETRISIVDADIKG